MLITFEGLDFSGKTTQAHRLIATLRRKERVVHFLREPGGTKISERIRDILLDKRFLEMNETAELLLFSASRTQLVAEVILPAMKRGEIIILDRYYDSTTAYQGYGRGLDLQAVRFINAFATGGLEPDLTFLIDISIEEIEKRKTAAGLNFDRMESSGREFYQRVRSGYLEIARTEVRRVVHIDGMGTPESVEKEIWQQVEKKLIVSNVSSGGR